MKEVDLQQPSLLLAPFCEEGTKNTLPLVNEDESNPQLADLKYGFPPETQGSPDDGKLPPERADFNALGFLTTSYDWFYQAGGTFTFNPIIATAIGGYPKNARLWYTNAGGISMILRSTKDDNSDNFLESESYIGLSWVVESFVGVQYNNIQIFDFKWSDKIIDDKSWVRSDAQNWEWYSKDDYPEAYGILKDSIAFKSESYQGNTYIVCDRTGFVNGNYNRSPQDDEVVDGVTYYAWKTNTVGEGINSFYLTLNSSASNLYGQTIYLKRSNTFVASGNKIASKQTRLFSGGGGFIYWVGSNGQKICNYQSINITELSNLFELEGIAWFYVIDKWEERFKLPRTKYAFDGIRTGVGNHIQAGLPNITGSFGQNLDVGVSGAFAKIYNSSEAIADGHHTNDGISFDASRSNPIYGNSNTVQPPATEMYLYFYLGGHNGYSGGYGGGSSTLAGLEDVDLSSLQNGDSLIYNSVSAKWENGKIDSLPAQTGQSGKFLTTNGNTASWDDIPQEIPTQTGNAGKFLTTDGSDVSWGDPLPDQTGNAGKYLKTDGTDSSWEVVASYDSSTRTITIGG